MRLEWAPHRAQWEISVSSARFKIVSCGRRFGKTLGAYMDELVFAAEHPGSICWWVAPVYKELGLSITPIVRDRTPQEFIGKKLEQQEVIRFLQLRNGSEIWFHSAENPETLRGGGIDYLVVDEPALMKRSVWENVLRPALSDRKGRVVFISTPKGGNWFRELWSRGQDPLFPDYKSWSFPTVANPYIDAGEVEDARRTLPEMVFRQEYLAEFLEDIGAVFRRVTDHVVKDELQSRGSRCLVGVDLAKHQDFTVLTAMDESGQVVGFDRFQQLDWVFQKQRIKGFAERFDGKVLMDSTGVGDPIFDDLSRMGLDVEGYKFTAPSKKALVENLSTMLDNDEITYPEIPELINELRIFGYKMGPSGNVSYSAPEGYHDDCVVSLALAAWLKGSYRPPMPMVA